MHIQIIRFNLKDMTAEQYHTLANSLAPTFAAMPDLLTKYWLADSDANTYGGVYVWRNRAAMQAFMQGEVAAAVSAHPNLTNITTTDFEVLDGPTRVTHGLAAVSA
jgi:quinol monooxygenase YgiN